jgi:hypothetical protein
MAEELSTEGGKHSILIPGYNGAMTIEAGVIQNKHSTDVVVPTN